MWTNQKIRQHEKAAKILLKIKDLAFDYMRANKTEHEVQQFIIKKFKEFDLKSDKDPPIVAFNENSAHVHYYPSKKSKKLKKNTLVMIDIWARLNSPGAPFADITWMAYHGNKILPRIQRIFNIVKKARDSSILFIKKELKKGRIPTGKEINQVTREIITKAGFSKKINLYTGHCIGYHSPHGNRKNINMTNNSPLLKNYGYTIEPGIYLKNEFGVRSEIDFYITKNKKLIITTDVQKKIIKV